LVYRSWQTSGVCILHKRLNEIVINREGCDIASFPLFVLSMDFFVYNTGEGTLEINEYQLFLIKEFKDLLDDKRNKCKDDKTGKLKLQARKELTYIWLVMDPKSPYSQFTEQEAHTVALDDSGLT
jgi:hypothetical protein